jgi:hypothetical protein
MNKRKDITGSAVIVILLSAIVFFGHAAGITGVTMKLGSTPGCTCHSATPSSNVNVVIAGPDTLSVNEESVYSVTITGGPLVAGGTDIAASTGTLSSQTGSGLRTENGELTHQSPKSPSGNNVTFQFIYVAPATTGTAVIYANGNSVNLNGNNTGDQWNFAPNKNVVIRNLPTGVTDPVNLSTFSLEQNYPNPFNPSTTIKYSLPESGKITLKVYDILGNEMALLEEGYKEKGIYSIAFTPNLASGIYFYRLQYSEGIITRKMLLLK